MTIEIFKIPRADSRGRWVVRWFSQRHREWHFTTLFSIPIGTGLPNAVSCLNKKRTKPQTKPCWATSGIDLGKISPIKHSKIR